MSEHKQSQLVSVEDEPRCDEYIDARGLDCPLPVLKAKLALSHMPSGTLLRVDATDPHARIDFEAYCARSGHKLLSISEVSSETRILIKRTAA